MLCSRVRLGEWSVKDKEDCWKGRGSWCLDPVQDFDIELEQVTVHEDYQPNGQFLNDIALVKLDRAALQRLGVSFACLPLDSRLAAKDLNVKDLKPESGLAGKYGIVVGWGYTEYDPYKGGVQGDIRELAVANNIQQKLQIPVLPPRECSLKFRGKITPAGEREKLSSHL